MKSSTRLDSVIFQLTPTRTRCDLIIVANERKEKMASGLLNPFLAHLKSAQDQIAKGGYSILLQPELGSDATWFTKGTVERFVRFVSTPEILERVYTVESEIVQIKEVISIQGSIDNGLSLGENHRGKPVEGSQGNKPMLDATGEKAIVLYEPDAHLSEINGSITEEGNSKVQLLKVLETRKIVLQKEQGMAFACAVAAGFDIDHMKDLVSFSECFGASRLLLACLRFMDLWKRKHETGQWLEIEVVDAMSNQMDFLAVNASGIMLSGVTNKQNESSCNIASKDNLKVAIEANTDERPPMDRHVPIDQQQELFQGHYPHPMFPPWPLQSSPGGFSVFQAYPVQGMPYHQKYSRNGAFYQPPYPPIDDSQFSVGHGTGQRRQSTRGRVSNTESEMCKMEASRTTSLDDLNLEKETSLNRELRKKAGGSGKKHTGMVVIRNINYITSKAEHSLGNESESASDSGAGTEGEDANATSIMHRSTLKSSKRKGSLAKSMDESTPYVKEESNYGKETDARQWQAFENFLLRGTDEDNSTTTSGMFASQRAVQMKRQQNVIRDDLLSLGEQKRVEVQDGRITEYRSVTGKVSRMPRASNDEVLISKGQGQHCHGRESVVGGMNMQFIEINGRKVRYRTGTNDDFVINGRENQSVMRDSSHAPTLNGVEHVSNDLNKNSSHDIVDESFLIPYRSVSINHAGADERTPINMDSELPSTQEKPESISGRIINQVNYVPDDLTLMPKRGTEKRTIGYDRDLGYKMQFSVEDAASLNKRNKEVVTDMKQRSAKLDKDRKAKLTQGTSDKKKTRGPLRKGKPSKLSPIDDARARAERVRAFKADLQKIKKEKEEAELKRLEALKRERQKRIAARGNSTCTQSPLPSLQNRTELATRLFPLSHRGSKFSDSEPGLSSPLQRSQIRAFSLGSIESKKVSRTLRSSDGGHSAGNRSSRSLLPLSEPKKESSDVTPDSKISIARIRRLSEPKISIHPASSIKTLSGGPLSRTKVSSALKPKASDGPESKKTSAIVNLDKSKATTALALKIRTSKGPSNIGLKRSAPTEPCKVNRGKSTVASKHSETRLNNGKMSHQSDVDDKPVIEKTVVMLECEKPYIPAVDLSVDRMEERKRHYNIHEMRDKIEVVTEYTTIRAPPSPVDGVDTNPRQLQEQQSSNEMTTNYKERESPKLSSTNTTKGPRQAPPCLRVSSEDPSVGSSKHGEVPPSLQVASIDVEIAEAHISNLQNSKVEKIPEIVEKPRMKESSKGFKQLLQFGRKNYGAMADHSINHTASSKEFDLSG